MHLSLPGTSKAFEFLRTYQVGYLMSSKEGDFQAAVIRPATMIFAARDDVVRWVFLTSLALLIATIALTNRLLERLVAQRIDATNDALARIMDGDLDARVEVGGTREFSHLSEGINQTVDALRGWIAEAESRMDAELATAKVIQESTQDGSWRWVRELSGLPLGIFDELPYTAYSLDCEVGDQILIYTDGVTEAFATDDEQYGEERLETLVNEYGALHPHELVERVRTSVAEFSEGTEQSDDITILALEVGVPPVKKAQLVVAADVDEVGHVIEFINAELDRRLCPVRVQLQLGIAVEELFVNSCSYAYEDAPASVEPYVRVTSSYSAEPRSITVEIVDNSNVVTLVKHW